MEMATSKEEEKNIGVFCFVSLFRITRSSARYHIKVRAYFKIHLSGGFCAFQIRHASLMWISVQIGPNADYKSFPMQHLSRNVTLCAYGSLIEIIHMKEEHREKGICVTGVSSIAGILPASSSRLKMALIQLRPVC